jgi:hypothetical protein
MKDHNELDLNIRDRVKVFGDNRSFIVCSNQDEWGDCLLRLESDRSVTLHRHPQHIQKIL